jgi:ADP-heptose:LPS heptosyltransferase
MTIQHPTPNTQYPKRIALFRALFLGDLLMSVPAFHALRRRFPDAEITLIGLPWAREFCDHITPAIDRVVEFAGYPGIREVPFDRDRVSRWLKEQRAYKYDLAIQMHGDGTISNGLVADLGAKTTLGCARPGDTRLTHTLPFADDQNEVLRWLDLLRLVGAEADQSAITFRTTEANEREADALLAAARSPIVGVHVGAKDAVRRWPAAKFAALADALADRCNATIVLTGSGGERDLTAAVSSLMHHQPLDLAGRTDIGTFAALLKKLDLLVTNDTGASHLAAAMRTPSVVLFGPTRPHQFAPLDRDLHCVIDAMEVVGIDDGAEALRRLPVEAVLDVIENRELRTKN